MITQRKREQLLRLAFKFYQTAEATSDDDWENVFTYLIDHDLEKLRSFVEDGDAANLE